MQLKTALLTAALAAAGISAQSFAAAPPAPNGTATGSFNVTANVVASCKVVSTADINFGNYDPANVNNTTPLNNNAGSVTVRCTKNTLAYVSLQQGSNPGSSSTCVAPARQMKDTAGDLLAYSIYQDSGYSNVWGCDSTNSQSFTSTSVNTPKVYTLYGQIPAGQDVPPASTYKDTVTTTVSF